MELHQFRKRTKNGQTNGQNYTNFEKNLAMMVIYLPVEFEFDWTNCPYTIASYYTLCTKLTVERTRNCGLFTLERLETGLN